MIVPSPKLETLPDTLTVELERELSMLVLLGVREISHMPPASDRSIARRIALQVLFELDCTTHVAEKIIIARIAAQEAPGKQARYVRLLVILVRKHLAFLDDTLRNYTIDWPPEQLAIVDRNILRMAILEFAITKSAPVAVVINEAIELARLFSGEESFDFINGVLGAIADEYAAEVPTKDAATKDSLESRQEDKSAPDKKKSPADPEGTWPGRVVSERAISRIVRTIAHSSSALLDGTTDVHDSLGTDLPRHVGSLPFDAERSVLTTVHELRGEREAQLFPGAAYLVISRGAADSLLALATNEHRSGASQPLETRRRVSWQMAIDDMAQQGWRVLGVAWRPLAEARDDQEDVPVDEGMPVA